MNPEGRGAYAPNPDATMLFQGAFDLGLSVEYSLTMILQGTDGEASASVSGVHVVIHHGDEIISDQLVVGTGFVAAGGYGLSSIKVIDAGLVEVLLKPLENRTVA